MKIIKDCEYYINELIHLEEFWDVNYYIRSIKKAPHGGVYRIDRPNTFLRYYPIECKC